MINLGDIEKRWPELSWEQKEETVRRAQLDFGEGSAEARLVSSLWSQSHLLAQVAGEGLTVDGTPATPGDWQRIVTLARENGGHITLSQDQLLAATKVMRSLGPMEGGEEATRSVKLTPASTIKPAPVLWLWQDRLALGTMALLAGREGIGKSTVAYQLAADVTRGRLPGVAQGQPRAVIVCATEDSWSHTIVPRLMAAEADLDLVYRVDVATADGIDTSLSLPRDLKRFEDAVVSVNAALVLLDPLMSRLDGSLDTHKDAEVRLALEPLVAIADRTKATTLGIIHVNKSGGSDPLNLVMGSKAFTAVVRAVLFAMVDPEDEGARILGQPKNNLGRTDLPTLAFAIVGAKVADHEDGEVWTGRIHWRGSSTRSLTDAIEAAAGGSDVRSAVAEAADWLEDWLTTTGGTDDSADIKREGARAGHGKDVLQRARRRLELLVTSEGFPRRTFWTLPGTVVAPVVATAGETHTTATTASTVETGPQSLQSLQSSDPREGCVNCGGVLDDASVLSQLTACKTCELAAISHGLALAIDTTQGQGNTTKGKATT